MSGKLHLDHAHLLELLGTMIRIRQFEAKCAELYQRQKIRGFLHLYDGEEAVSTGVIHTLTAEDAIVATYREHGQAIARGLPMSGLMAELYGRVEGCCRGRGGSMHLFDASRRFFGGNAIVGGGLPLAVGIALADQIRRPGAVTVCFFGEGAVDEGEFHESLNLAALWKLPVLFVCENNLYSMGTPVAIAESQVDVAAKAGSYALTAESVDGMDVVAVEIAARKLLAEVRAGAGPAFLECRTYRFRAHSMFDAQLYREKAEIEVWKARDPINRFREWLAASGLVFEDELARLEREAREEVAAAVAFAEAGTPEAETDLERFVCMEKVPA